MQTIRNCKSSQWKRNQIPQSDKQLTTTGKDYEVIRTENNYDIVIDDNGDELEVGKYSAYFCERQEVR